MSTNDDTIEIRAGENFDITRIEHFVRAQIKDLGDEPLVVRQFPAGASNLTYLLKIGTWEGVLRRPPFGPIPPKAHDMGREAHLLQKIHPVFQLAPRPYVICTDTSIMGVPFYIMERRKGIVLDNRFPPDYEVTPNLCRRLSYTVVDTLVQIHHIDWQKAGLSDLGHPSGFLERQVHGWIERYQRAQTEEIPQLAALTHWLIKHIPVSPEPTLIHNDYKLNNMLLHPHDLTRVEAVLDWEMATIGDPLFDLAVTLSYWVNQSDPEILRTMLPTVTTSEGFISREEFMEAYAQKSGRDISAMNFYMVFAYFKLAVIIQQIYVRWKRGQTQDKRFASFGERARALIDYTAQLAAHGSG
jgi:aminoglycoside phosphotransferase (APT) family kinase protein